MWIEKVAHGILELDTPVGPRYLELTFFERARLTWTFRNFSSLPQEVLGRSERRLIDRLWNENRFVSLSLDGTSDRPVIGRVERRALASLEIMPERKPPAASKAALADEGREAVSA
jgi:hypothetical protein